MYLPVLSTTQLWRWQTSHKTLAVRAFLLKYRGALSMDNWFPDEWSHHSRPPKQYMQSYERELMGSAPYITLGSDRGGGPIFRISPWTLVLLNTQSMYFNSAWHRAGVYLEGGEHRDIPLLRLIPLPRFLNCTYRIVLKFWTCLISLSWRTCS